MLDYMSVENIGSTFVITFEIEVIENSVSDDHNVEEGERGL
jgi:hypothetical protein